MCFQVDLGKTFRQAPLCFILSGSVVCWLQCCGAAGHADISTRSCLVSCACLLPVVLPASRWSIPLVRPPAPPTCKVVSRSPRSLPPPLCMSPHHHHHAACLSPPADLSLAAQALKVFVTLCKVKPEAAPAVADAALPPALSLVASPLLQVGLSTMQPTFACLDDSGYPGKWRLGSHAHISGTPEQYWQHCGAPC
jgi:hypothetical protein